jgi:hypothetical protein
MSQRGKGGGTKARVEEDLDLVLANRGVLGRLFRRFFRVIERSWQMYPLGVLFGLGFDTATEVGLLGISATQASQGLSIWSILVFPALFTAGMTVIDTTDSILMQGAYGWAFVKPIRKLYYNLTITAVSVVVAVVVGGLEALNLVGDQLGLTDGGGFWGAIGAINDNFGILGYGIVGLFLVSWLISWVVYRAKRYDEIEVSTGEVSETVSFPLKGTKLRLENLESYLRSRIGRVDGSKRKPADDSDKDAFAGRGRGAARSRRRSCRGRVRCERCGAGRKGVERTRSRPFAF